MNEDNKLDDIFKRELDDPVNHADYNEGDWNDFEKLLDNSHKRRGLVYLLPILSGLAAMLLLIAGWWFFGRGTNLQHSVKNHLSNSQPKRNTGTNGGARQHTSQPEKELAPASVAVNLVHGNKGSGYRSFLFPSAAGSRRTAGPGIALNNSMANRSGETLTVNPPGYETGLKLLPPDTIPVIKLNYGNIITGKPGDKMAKTQINNSFRPQFTLSIVAAPDINGVGGLREGKVGTNAGLLFSAELVKKLTFSTGAIYSAKPYLTNFSNYHSDYQFKVNPVNVTADCRMLDIPVNIDYRVYRKRQDAISVGTGLSSYIMLHESYKFNYSGMYGTDPALYNVPGISKYYFGVLNLNVTYQHQLNSKAGISLQPYMKLPITNIGYSRVRLQTMGVAAGISWNLNPK